MPRKMKWQQLRKFACLECSAAPSSSGLLCLENSRTERTVREQGFHRENRKKVRKAAVAILCLSFSHLASFLKSLEKKREECIPNSP